MDLGGQCHDLCAEVTRLRAIGHGAEPPGLSDVAIKCGTDVVVARHHGPWHRALDHMPEICPPDQARPHLFPSLPPLFLLNFPYPLRSLNSTFGTWILSIDLREQSILPPPQFVCIDSDHVLCILQTLVSLEFMFSECILQYGFEA